MSDWNTCEDNPKTYLGSKYQHDKDSEKEIDRFVNVTRKDSIPLENGDLLPVDSCTETLIDNNCYSQSGTVDLSSCHKQGWKAVHASKYFHGRIGLTDPLYCGGCQNVTSKFRTIKRTVLVDRYAEYDPGTGVIENTQTAEITKTATVDQDSGVVTMSNCVGDYYDNSVSIGLGFSFVWDQLLSLFYAESGCGEIVTVDTSQVPPGGTGSSPPDMIWFPSGETVADIISSFEALNVDSGNIYTHIDVTGEMTNTHLIISASWKDGINKRWNGTSWEVIDEDEAARGSSWGTWSVEIELSDEQTPGGLLGEVTNKLLSEWDLSDDVVYPWRTDVDCFDVPLVMHNEVQEAVTPDKGMFPDSEVWCDFEDPNAEIYDGAIIGAPLPGGYGPHYSFILNEWSDGNLPLTSTYWGNPGGANMTDGGTVYFDGAALHARKFCMTQGVWPGHNFARPCGADADDIWQADPDFCTDPQLRWPSAPAQCSGEWNTSAPHGDWVLLEFLDDFCETTHTANCVQKCSVFMPCCPSVLAVGCDSESFCHAYNEAFPTEFEPAKDGWRWNRIPVAAMPDPLFEPPHDDCETNLPVAYITPYIEARCSAPTGAPSMPLDHVGGSALVFGCPSEIGWCAQPAGETCYSRATESEEDI